MVFAQDRVQQRFQSRMFPLQLHVVEVFVVVFTVFLWFRAPQWVARCIPFVDTAQWTSSDIAPELGGVLTVSDEPARFLRSLICSGIGWKPRPTRTLSTSCRISSTRKWRHCTFLQSEWPSPSLLKLEPILQVSRSKVFSSAHVLSRTGPHFGATVSVKIVLAVPERNHSGPLFRATLMHGDSSPTLSSPCASSLYGTTVLYGDSVGTLLLLTLQDTCCRTFSADPYFACWSPGKTFGVHLSAFPDMKPPLA